MKTLARYLQLASRYAENPTAFSIKLRGGIPGTYWKLDHKWFRNLNLQSVIDVGANEGQFSLTLRALLPQAKIYAFEPIPDCFSRTKLKFSRDANFKIFNLALAERKGRATFTIASGDTGASSLLPVAEAQQHHFPHTLKGRQIEVQIETLDGVMNGEGLPKPYLLKVDVQGYEHQVLTGGSNVLSNASVVILEASYKPFYQGQKLFDEVYDQLRSYGFYFLDNFNMMYSPEDGQALQGDFLFLKS